MTADDISVSFALTAVFTLLLSIELRSTHAAIPAGTPSPVGDVPEEGSAYVLADAAHFRHLRTLAVYETK